jgi:enamine deaminase RidA (YjgF/YER057c/UK114 family)
LAHLDRLFMVGAVVVLAGCAGRASPSTTPSPSCAVSDTALVKDVLYFGRNRPGGGAVTDEEWQSFLDQVLTPRFPAGLTVVAATGQWKGESGLVEQERSEVVTVFHSGDEAARRAVIEVVVEYKRRFQQEAVLRERMPTCARFE